MAYLKMSHVEVWGQWMQKACRQFSGLWRAEENFYNVAWQDYQMEDEMQY